MEDDDFSFIQPLDLITKDACELQRIIKEKKENLHKDRFEANEKNTESKQDNEQEHAQAREEEKQGRENEQEHDKEMSNKDREQETVKDKEFAHPDQIGMENSDDKVVGKHEEIGDCGGNFHLLFSLILFMKICYSSYCYLSQPYITVAMHAIWKFRVHLIGGIDDRMKLTK